MTGWTWSLKGLRWHEWLMLLLAYVTHNEGPFVYSDLVRGVAVGLFIGALVAMIAIRRATCVLFCALGVVTAFGMTPRSGTSGVAIVPHVMTAWALLVPIINVWQKRRRTRLAEQPATN